MTQCNEGKWTPKELTLLMKATEAYATYTDAATFTPEGVRDVVYHMLTTAAGDIEVPTEKYPAGVKWNTATAKKFATATKNKITRNNVSTDAPRAYHCNVPVPTLTGVVC